MEKLSFASDYMEGAHPQILKKLSETNFMKSAGYGTDEFSETAREKIRVACGTPEAEVYFLAGGTQTNAVMIDAFLRSYQGVIAADTAHIESHEAGAIEFGGHKVLTVHHKEGKITAEAVKKVIDAYNGDENREHTVMPGMVYISHPSEYGTIYSLEELTEISRVCRQSGIPLYLDGARLAYALACPENDVSLRDIGRLCDAFYIGGTKCGTLFGEAVVIPRKGLLPHIFTIIKQHGALLAKGRIAALQFDVLFTDNLYFEAGKNAVRLANKIKNALKEKGYALAIDAPTNQVFPIFDNEKLIRLSEKVDMGFWERINPRQTVMRIAVSWATTEEEVDRLIELL